MKKILLTLCLGVATWGVMHAQQKQPVFGTTPKMDNTVVDGTINKDRFKVPANKKTRGGSAYFDYVDYVAAQEGISSTTLDANSSLYYMFPDSVVRYGAPNSNFGIAWKSIGQVFEPWADVIRTNTPTDQIYIGKTNAYNVDSIFIRAAYIKKTSAVDTLIMSVVHSGGANLPTYYFTGMAADFGVDTTRFLLQSFNPTYFTSGPYQTNATGAPAAYTLKYPLTNADSSTFTAPNLFGTKYIGFAPNFAVPAGEQVSVSFTFKPGYTYAAGDTVAKNNQFLFFSYEPNGSSTFMPFYPADRNMSSVIYKDSTGWYGDYVPTLAWTAPYSCEMHDIIWKLSCATCSPIGVNNVNDDIQVKLLSNPVNDEARFSIRLNESTQHLSVTFTNTMGEVIKQVNLGSLNAGNTQLYPVSLSDLSSGLYMYTIQADGKSYTGKVVKD